MMFCHWTIIDSVNSCIESIQNELEVNDTTDSQKSASYLLTLPEYFRSPPVFSGVRVTRYLALCVCFVDRCLFFCTFFFSHSTVCSSSIFRFRIPFGIFKLFLTFTLLRCLYNILYFLWLYNEFYIILYNIIKIAELDWCQIIILSIYVPSTHA